MKEIGSLVSEWAKGRRIPCSYFKATESTQLDSKKSSLIESVAINEPILFVTDNQTKGRGRGENTWTSPSPGTALLSTWSYRSLDAVSVVFPARVGLALFRSCRELWPSLKWSLKAPNDLYCEDKKIAGLLIEVVSSNFHVLHIGVGVNVVGTPSLNTAGNIQEFLKRNMMDREFKKFLDVFYNRLGNAVLTCADDILSDTDREELKRALNVHPHYFDEVLSVMEDASLETVEGIVPWSML